MEYSRTRKYEELRNKLQNDAEEDIRTGDLSGFEERLNRIDPNSFEAPMEYTGARDYDPVHARNNDPRPVVKPFQDADSVFEKPRVQAQAREKVDLNDVSFLKGNANDTNIFDNDYLSEYLREVKEYNVQQGNAFTQDTDVNVLKSLRGEVTTPRRPYSDPDSSSREREQMEATASIRPMGPIGEPARPAGEVKQNTGSGTIDIPFFEQDDDDLSFLPEDDYLPVGDEPARQDTKTGRTMSRADIAAEVQQMISNQDSADMPSFMTSEHQTQSSALPAAENTVTRDELLMQTTQMQSQLDDYEENLSDMNDKMNRTNSLLNFVLIVVIIALAAGLAVVLYWILVAKGVL